ncbi:unnamed protein product, partial [Didymodactylos carnosus]
CHFTFLVHISSICCVYHIKWLSIITATILVAIFLTLTAYNRNKLLPSKVYVNVARWSEKQANEWYSRQPWYVGANFIPSTAVNVLEMWQEDTFDIRTIASEIRWASTTYNMNIMRVFLHYLLWKENAKKFYNRIEQFLNQCETYGIKVIFVLFDECWNPLPKLGKQPKPIPGVHNSQWVRCPGQNILEDQTKWTMLKQ